jgi:hypothetical protein
MANLAYQDNGPGTAGVGHNAAPTSDPFPAIKSRADALAATANEWLANVKTITDQETAEACDSFLSQLAAELAASEKDRKAINAPHDLAVKTNNDRFRPVTALLETCQRLMKPLKAGWLQRERDRLAAEKAAAEAEALKRMEALEEARRQEAAAAVPTVGAVMALAEAEREQDEALAALAVAEKAKPVVKGTMAARASGLRQYWSANVTDWPAAIRHYQDRAEVRDVVQRLANADARDRKELLALLVPGVEPKMEERA